MSQENFKYNDINQTINTKIEDKLRATGMEEGLLKHFGHKLSFRQLNPAKRIQNVSFREQRTLDNHFVCHKEIIYSIYFMRILKNKLKPTSTILTIASGRL